MSKAVNLAKLIAETKREIDRTSNSIDSELDRSRKTTTRIKADFEKKQEVSKVSLGELISKLSTDLEGLMKHFSAEKEERLSKGLADVEQSLKEALTHTRQLYASVQEEVKSKNKTFLQQTEEQYQKKAEILKENLTKVFPFQEKHAETLRKICTENLSDMRSKISDLVNSEAKNHKSTTVALKNKVKESFDNFAVETTTLAREEDSQVKSMYQEGEKELVDLVNTASNKMEEVINNAITSAHSYLESNKEKAQESLNNLKIKAVEISGTQKTDTEKLESDFKEKMSEFRSKETESFEKMLEESNTNLQNNLELNKDKMDDLVLKTRNQLREELYKELDDVASAFTNFHDTFLGQINDTIARLQESAKGMQDTLSGILIQRLDRMQQLGVRFENLVEETFNDAQDIHREESTTTFNTYKGAVDTEFNNISNKFEEFEQEITKLVEESFSSHKNALVEYSAQITNVINDQNTQTQNETQKTKSQIADDLNNLATNQKTAFEQNITSFKDSLNSSKTQLSEKINKIPSLVEELIKKNSEEINQKMQATVEGIEQMRNTALETASNIEKETTATTNQQLDEAIADAKIMDQGNQQHLTEFLENSLNEYTELTTNYSTDIATRFSESIGKVEDIEKEVFTDIKGFFDKHILLATNFIDDGMKLVNEARKFKTEYEQNSVTMTKETLDEVEQFYKTYFDLGKQVTGKAKDISKNTDQIIREVKKK
ncbi:MAG: hypothetical protein ACFFBD_13075 [Candidatus Hodarchaeota archaeon]